MARRFIFEVHPEVSFAAWNGGMPIADPKKLPEGMEKRTKLIEEHFGHEARNAIRGRYPQNLVAEDDINDAFAALWTAERIQSGVAKVIPSPPEIDTLGIEMGMWY